MSFRRSLLVVLPIVAILSALGFFWPFHRDVDALKLPGVVEIQEVRLGSKVGGRVAQVLVAEGDIVESGQKLVVLAIPELLAQEQQAEARLKAAIADLEKARAGYRSEEKIAAAASVDAAKSKVQMLKKGARPEEIRDARAQLESIQAELQLARDEYDRARKLLRQNAGAQADYDINRMSILRNIGMEARAKAQLDLLLAGAREEEIEMAEADLRRLLAQAALVKAGTRPEEIAMADARVGECRGKLRELQAMVAEADVVASERAFVDVVAVRKGDLVVPNQPVVRVLRADDIWVKVYVPETDLGRLRPNQPVTVMVDGYPKRRFQGKIMHIAAESEFTPRNVQSADERKHQVFGVKVRVDDPDGIYKAGMAATVFLRNSD